MFKVKNEKKFSQVILNLSGTIIGSRTWWAAENFSAFLQVSIVKATFLKGINLYLCKSSRIMYNRVDWRKFEEWTRIKAGRKSVIASPRPILLFDHARSSIQSAVLPSSGAGLRNATSLFHGGRTQVSTPRLVQVRQRTPGIYSQLDLEVVQSIGPITAIFDVVLDRRSS